MYILRPNSVVPPTHWWLAVVSASLSPASAILPLPDRQEPSAEVENGCAAGSGSACGRLHQIPLADTAW